MIRKIKLITALVLAAVLAFGTAVFATPPNVSVSAVYGGDGNIRITTSNFYYEDPTDELWFAVWTDVNGQDDLDWYRADANFACTVSMAKHGNYKGLYYIHAYTYDIHDVPTYVADTTFVYSGQPAVTASDVQGNGDYIDIAVENYTKPSGADLQVAVWSDVNGQDDLTWRDMEMGSDGRYHYTVDIRNDHSGTGTYLAHVYCIAGSVYDFVGAASFNIQEKQVSSPAQPVSGGVSLNFENHSNKKGSCTIAVGGIAQTGVSRVRAAVWSAGDQSDIYWYDLNGGAGNRWTVGMTLANHQNHLGDYNVHIYVVYADGRAECVIGGVVTFADPAVVPDPVANEVTLQTVKDTFTLTCTSPKKGIRSLDFALWSEANSQDDLVWYEAAFDAASSSGKITLTKAQLPESGSYLCHVYAEMADGSSEFVAALAFYAEAEPEPVKDQVVLELVNNKYVLNCTTAKTNVRRLRFAVWSQNNGQDDLQWYNVAVDASANGGKLELASSQLPETGVYICHVYAEMKNGGMEYVANTEFKADKGAGTLRVIAEADEAGGFVLSAEGINGAFPDVKTVDFAVWSEVNGQDDLIWYEGTKAADGAYTVQSDFTRHASSTGEYHCHVYVTRMNGSESFACGTDFDVEEAGGELTLSVSDGVDERFYTVTLTHVPSSMNVSRVRFAVWSQNDAQDDLIWYTANQQGSRYVLDLDVKDHGGSGTYYIHAYGVTPSGEYIFLKESTDLVVNSSATGRISVTNLDARNGRFDVVVRPESSSIPVEGVKVYIWCNEDKSDRGVYTAYPQNDGSFRAYINTENHGYHTGMYKIAANAVLANGCECQMATGRQYFSMSSSTVVSGTEGTNVRRVSYSNPSVSNVRAAVWTVDKGQDDLVWYEGIPDGAGGYYFDVAGSRHSGDGTYIVHLFSGEDFLESTQFTMISYVERAIAMGMDESIGYSQVRRYLNPDADCSSFVFYALVHSGYGGIGSGPFYTGTMVNVMKNAGWQVLPFTGMDNLQPGDILWYRRTDLQGTHGHTEIYIGDGRMVGAHGDDGSIYESIGGDQTGKEVCEVAFHNPGWMTVLRLLDL